MATMPISVQPNAHTAFEPTAYVESFVEIDGLRLHVQDYGASGKPHMLCVHGGGANAHWYDFVAQGFNAVIKGKKLTVRPNLAGTTPGSVLVMLYNIRQADLP